MTSREQFETWAKKEKLGIAYGDCGYVFSSTEMAWRAWQYQNADMAVQLANAESKCRELSSKAMELVCEASLVYSKYNDTQMPDRDIVDMQTLQEMHDLCKGSAQ